MGWLADVWTRRVPITLDNTVGAAGIDADVSIPAWFDAFWEVIDANGDELRVTHADGVTVLDYSVDGAAAGSFDRSTRSGRLRIDGLTTPATPSVVLAWLYFDSMAAQGAGSTSTTITSPVDGLIDLARPSQLQTLAQPQRPGLTRPRHVLTKGGNEQVNVWVHLLPLERQTSPGRAHRVYEEPWYLELSVLDDAGGNNAGRFDLAKSSFVQVAGGRRIALKCHVKAGDSGGAYVVVPRLGTVVPGGSSVNRTLEPRVGLLVQDVNETVVAET